jgi:histidinol-phosphate phosphatase family protein
MSDERRAAFLDRDGTLIEDANYLASADSVRLLPGVVDSVRTLNDRGILVIVITNQSGIAQGLLTEAQYESTRARLDELLEAGGARIDATYHCPHYPSISGPCDCRKPGTLLYRRAAETHKINVHESLYVGDRFRDIAPGLALGGFVRLVPSGSTMPEDLDRARQRQVIADSLGDAIGQYLTRFVA